MHSATQYAIGLIFACAFSFAGRVMANNPERTSRMFSFGNTPTNFHVKYFRFTGLFFFVMGGLGAIFYMILIAPALFGFSLG